MPLAFSLSLSLAQCLCVCPCRLSLGSLNAPENIAREENAGSMELYWNVSRLEPMKSRLACHCISLLSVSEEREGEELRGAPLLPLWWCVCAPEDITKEAPLFPYAHTKSAAACCCRQNTESRKFRPVPQREGNLVTQQSETLGALPTVLVFESTANGTYYEPSPSA